MAHTGKIKFFDYKKGFGKITKDSDQSDLHLHISDLEKESEIVVLADSECLTGEPVIFDIGPGRTGEKAVKVQLDLSKRSVGYIREYEVGKFGKIEDFASKASYQLHFSNVKGTSGKFIKIETDKPVVFTPITNQGRKEAIEIVLIDDRYPLELFAEFSDLNQSLKYLATAPHLAETKNEFWDYIKKPTGRVPVLFSYITQTFLRIALQEKIIFSKPKDGKEEFACFNTGLVTKEQDEIYAYFSSNSKYHEKTKWGISIPKWSFLEFNTDHRSKNSKYFSKLPEMATFFEDTEISQLIFDTSIKVTLNQPHLISRKDRFLKNGKPNPDIQNLSDDEFIDKVKIALDLATKRAKRNYKTAIPHFYNDRIQFLLPLCVTSKIDADVALVVARDEESYEAHTLLTLDQAYNNARLLSKPDREWLTP